MGLIGDDSDDEYGRELKLAVERYRNNRKAARKKDWEKSEVVHGKNKWLNEPKKKGNVSKGICLKEYENQGAIPKVSERFWESFYYLVPQEPSPDFFLPPGLYYVVSKPLEMSTETVLVCHPQRLEKLSRRGGPKTGKHNRKHIEHFVVSPTNVNDVNKSERNCSNVALVRELISEYNLGKLKGDILAKMKTVKSDLEAEIEGFKSALEESTMALDQLITLEFSLNYKLSPDKELGNKDINIKENFKGPESCEENGAGVNSPIENCLVNQEGGEGGEGGSDVENSSTNEELAPAEEERAEEGAVPSETQDPGVRAEEHSEKPAEEYSGELTFDNNRELAEEHSGEPAEEFNEERVQEDKITSKILEITSVLNDISETYLRTELEKMGDDVDLINTFVDKLFEDENYPKRQVDPDEDERKRLWKEYVTDFNPKKFLFAVSIDSPKGAATSESNDNDDINLVSSFLRRRYPTQPLADLLDFNDISKNIAEVCKLYDGVEAPVRLSESGFWEEKFSKEFLLKVIYLDHRYEIDDYLSGIQKRKKLEREEAKLCNAFLHCITCFSEIIPSETTTCSEGHVFCSSCVEEYIRVELGKGIYKFKCFSGNCDGFFGYKTLEELLPASLLSKISMKQQAEEIMKADIEGLESCPFCDFACIPDPDDKIFNCQNPTCMAVTCRLCHERNHIPLRCDEIERPKDVEARKAIEEAMTNAVVRYCPNCTKKIVKLDGCNEITCVCGALFCYLCQKQIYDCSHFGQ